MVSGEWLVNGGGQARKSIAPAMRGTAAAINGKRTGAARGGSETREAGSGIRHGTGYPPSLHLRGYGGQGAAPLRVEGWKALRQFLGSNDMMAYLVMMAIRLIELHRVLKPTGPMNKEGAEAGFYDPPGLLPAVARVQILTIEELLAGGKLEYPRIDVATFKKAPRRRKAKKTE